MADFKSRSISLLIELKEAAEGWWIRANRCGRCDRRWVSEGMAEPVRCPNVHCRSEYWNRPVKNPALQAAQLKRWKRERRGK